MPEPEKKELEDQWLRTWEPTPEVTAAAEKINLILNDGSLTQQQQSAEVYKILTAE